jgi:ferredoxin
MSTLAVPGFIEEVRKYGTFDANACLNCGSCTVACDLSSDHASFPRKAMQRTVLGLKRSILASLDPWLCHDCGDCSITCPRQAEPRESMRTLKRYLTAQYEITGLSSRILRSKAWELIANSAVALLVLILVVIYHLYQVQLPLSDFVSTPMGLEHMFNTIVYFTVVVFLLPLLVLIANAIRMYRFTMCGENQKIPLRFYLLEAKTMFVHLVSHKNLRKCAQPIEKKRWVKHWLLGLAISLMIVIKFFFLKWFQTDNIYPIYNPQRWLGYFAAAVMIYVSFDILKGRIKKREDMYKQSEFSDLLLPLMLMLVGLSGLAVHIFRYLGFSLTCHYAYAVHLAIAVPLVVIELPFGKWSHVIYHPLALYFQAVKERALAEAKPLVGEQLPNESILKGGQPA